MQVTSLHLFTTQSQNTDAEFDQDPLTLVSLTSNFTAPRTTGCLWSTQIPWPLVLTSTATPPPCQKLATGNMLHGNERHPNVDVRADAFHHTPPQPTCQVLNVQYCKTWCPSTPLHSREKTGVSLCVQQPYCNQSTTLLQPIHQQGC